MDLPGSRFPDSGAVGLKLPGWLWSEKLCWLSGIDIESHIGWVDEALAFMVVRLASLSQPTTQALVATAREHHRIGPAVCPNGSRGTAS